MVTNMRKTSTTLAGSSLPRTDTALPAPPERDMAGEIVGSADREQGWIEDEQGNRVDEIPVGQLLPVTHEFKKQLTAYFRSCIEVCKWPVHAATTAFLSLRSALGITGRPPKL